MDCDGAGCEGGRIRHQHSRIHPDYLEKHLKEHAYIMPIGTRIPIGANCDCPRMLGPLTFGKCQACKGTGRMIKHIVVPKRGNKVKIVDPQLVYEVLGDDADPTVPAIVVDTQTPAEHGLELGTGIGIRVTWDFDGLTKTYTIRKDAEIDLWTFDLLEVEII